MGKTRRIEAWSKEPCHECGVEFQITRAEPIEVPKDHELLCTTCDAYWRGYNDAKAEAGKD